MSTPTPIQKDQTLTPVPHVVSVIVGTITGFLTAKLPWIPPQYIALVGIGMTGLMTTGVHFIMAKLEE